MRILIVIAMMFAITSCSVLFIEKVPDGYEPPEALYCSSSPVAPLLDTLFAASNLMAGAAQLDENETLLGLSTLALGGVFLSSLAGGFSDVSDCNDKRKTLAEYVKSAPRGEEAGRGADPFDIFFIPDSPRSGTKGGSCYGNGTCNKALLCLEGRCRLPTEARDGTEYGACYGNDTCNDDLVCDLATKSCSAIAPAGKIGGSCSAEQKCDDKLVCEVTKNKCISESNFIEKPADCSEEGGECDFAAPIPGAEEGGDGEESVTPKNVMQPPARILADEPTEVDSKHTTPVGRKKNGEESVTPKNTMPPLTLNFTATPSPTAEIDSKFTTPVAEGQTGGLTGRKKIALGFGGAGLIAVGIGTYFGVNAIDRREDATDAVKNCEGLAAVCNSAGQRLYEEARSSADKSSIFFGGSVAAALVGGYFWFFGEDTKRSSVSLLPASLHNSMGASLWGVF